MCALSKRCFVVIRHELQCSLSMCGGFFVGIAEAEYTISTAARSTSLLQRAPRSPIKGNDTPHPVIHKRDLGSVGSVLFVATRGMVVLFVATRGMVGTALSTVIGQTKLALYFPRGQPGPGIEPHSS